MTLLLRLFLLVAVALLPAIAIESYNQFDLHRLQQSEVEEHALNLAKLAAAQQLEIVEAIHQVLIALSELPAIKARDSQTCSKYLLATKQRYPAFHFIVVDMSGKSVCSTSGESGSVAGRADFVNATRSGHFAVGQFSTGVLTGRQLIPFALPFYDDEGRMAGAIITGLNLDWLAEFAVHMGIPSGAAIAIRDRKGTYLVRHPDNGRFVGRKIPGDRSFDPDHSGTIDTLDVDGVQRIVGYSVLKAGDGGLIVTIGLDKSEAFGAIRRRTRSGILLIVLSTSVVLALTWLGARRFIQHPLRQLVEAANQWRLGDYACRADIRDKRSEITRVGEAFNGMADALADREYELHDAKEKAEAAKEKAEQAAARITTIFECMTDCVVIVDPSWRITYLNERARARLSGEDDLIGKNLCETFPDAIDPKIGSQFHEAIAEQRVASFETFYRDVWYDVHAFSSGEGIAVLFRDITEHKRALEARRLVEEQLHQSQKMESVGQLTGGVAHDFNNLLAVVSANLDLIEHAADNGKVRRFAVSARRAADRGAKLTAQLLAFSRQQDLNPKLINVNELISDFLGLVRQAVGSGCEVKLKTDERLWLCQVDPSLLETALLNLALNGRDAMRRGGVLEIETRNVVLDEGAVAGCPPGSYVRLSVADTGEGMSPEVRERIFEPFFTTKEVGKGTGLGLSMVYGFVRQSGGYIAVESAPNAGTTIALHLPKAAQETYGEAEADEIRTMLGGSERILLVEDNEDLLEVTSEMLTGSGYQVRSARNGTEAIRILDSGGQFDLLFSDVVMPNGPNGVELAREAKRRSGTIKVLLTSGYAGDLLTHHAAVDEFPIIHKPFRLSELAQRLRSVLQKGRD
ncbi:ATP-binding protein [Bradyrhizobium sp. Tv2a-2]|uniref:ATP-binding protein n=1 Tax=Bradyrhizobium sp. Tv2a-2 TaxID=113395 RepID=UPI0004174C20|nr:ATP-binding protein [Bradyrhizobium sp. Tv2a-2]